MATTTNFGWETPDDTDLVKDGAAAIRTLGSAIDTSLVDLKGGTTGQVLAKASNTNLDFIWTSVDPLTILDAKGDLITATAADTPARLAVGTNGQILTADSSTSTGLKWETPTTSTGPTYGASRSSNQTVTTNVWTKLQISTEDWDSDACYDPTTNYRFTANKAGYYQITSQAATNGQTASYISIYKNGSNYIDRASVGTASLGARPNVTAIVYLNGTTDYIEIYGLTSGTIFNDQRVYGVWVHA